MGAARSRMPIPAVTLKHRTTHNSQNCGVLIASLAVRSGPAPCGVFGPTFRTTGGSHCVAGSRTKTIPMVMKNAYTTPITRKVVARPWRSVPNHFINCDDQGEAMSAPPPNPMMAKPVAIPGRSGNHFISVETGEM